MNDRIIELRSATVPSKVEREVNGVMSRLKISHWLGHRFVFFPTKEFFVPSNINSSGEMMGKCWQMSNFHGALMRDNDKVVRGSIDAHCRYKWYDFEHGYNIFRRNNIEYVFDPAFSILCEKNDYDKIFNPRISGHTTGRKIKNTLIEKWRNPDEITWRNKPMIEGFIGISGEEDFNAPLYRGSYEYKLKLNKLDKIKEIELHSFRGG